MAPRKRQPSGHLTWEQATAKFIPWAISLMVGYATYNIDRLTESVSNLNITLTKSSAIIEAHEYRLNQHRDAIKELREVDRSHDSDLATLKAKQ